MASGLARLWINKMTAICTINQQFSDLWQFYEMQTNNDKTIHKNNISYVNARA